MAGHGWASWKQEYLSLELGPDADLEQVFFFVPLHHLTLFAKTDPPGQTWPCAFLLPAQIIRHSTADSSIGT
jgi:hypothetical protein